MESMKVFKFYSTLTSLGLGAGSSVLDVIKAMPDQSIFIRGNVYNDNTIAGDMPPGYINGGVLIIIKSNKN